MEECSQVTNYEGQVCSDELTNWQKCFTGPQANDVQVPSDIDQMEAESLANTLLGRLPILGPSPECVAAIRPFTCLYLFGLCDTNNQLHQVSQRDCVRLRDELCPDQWATAVLFLGEEALPNCDTLVDQETQCLGKAYKANSSY